MGDFMLSENNESTETTEIVTEAVETGIKTFTQEEVNSLIESRLARAKKQMPSKDEIEAFKQWKESQKSEAERLAQREQEYQQIVNEKETIRRENTVLKLGVSAEEADYVLFKVSKLDGDFDENLKIFLTENPRYLNKTNTVRNTGVLTNSQIKREELGFESLIKKRNPHIEFKE
jgi:hypothetical protein